MKRCTCWLWLSAAVASRGIVVAANAAASTNEDPIGALLQQMDDLLAGWDRLEKQMELVLEDAADHKIVKTKNDIQQERQACKAHQASIQSSWTAWNKGQWTALQTQLENILHAETERRLSTQQQIDEYQRKKEHIKRQKAQAATGQPIEKMPRGLTAAQVADILSPADFMQQRDELMGSWIKELMKDIMARQPIPDWKWAQNLFTANDDGTATTTNTAQDDAAGCWTLLDSVVLIQQALTNYSHDDGLGVTDHARGGRIVHHSTSPTHHDTAKLNGEDDARMLGSSLLRDNFIPEDVEEYILAHVQGWKDWSFWPLNLDLSHSLARLTGAASAPAAPPETVLQGATWPGACWPMQGSAGQITIVLPYAVHPTAISIDHVSKLLVNKDNQRDSAPRNMRVFAYAPCNVHDCKGLEYNEHDMYDLFQGKSIEYNLEGNAVQTFWLPRPKLVKSHDNDDGNGDPNSCQVPQDDDEEEAVIASCSGEFPTLSPDSLVRAIKLQVLDNWGNGDYTCMYRIRVHGTPQQ